MESSSVENDGDNEDDDEEFADKQQPNFNSPMSQELNETSEETTTDHDESDETPLSSSSSNRNIKNEFKIKNQFAWSAVVANTNAHAHAHNNVASSNSDNSLTSPPIRVVEVADLDEDLASKEKEKEEEQDSPQILRPILSLKEQFLSNHKNHGVDSRTYRKLHLPTRAKLMQSEFTTKMKYFGQLNGNSKLIRPLASSSEEMLSKQEQEPTETNYDLSSKGIETGFMSMMIDTNNDGHYNMAHVSNSHSPSTSLNYEENTHSNTLKSNTEQNYSASVNDLTNNQTQTGGLKQLPQQQVNESGLFFNNSLMNVSMLDNIQATNTNLDYMSSSILMFN